MKLTVFALQAFLQHRQFITIKKSIFYIDLHSSKPNEPRQRHFSVSPSFCQMIWENILNNKIKQSVVHLKSKAQRNVPTLIWHLTVAVQEGQVVSGRERTIQIIFIILVLIIFFSQIYIFGEDRIRTVFSHQWSRTTAYDLVSAGFKCKNQHIYQLVSRKK